VLAGQLRRKMIVTLTDEILHGAVTRMMPTDIGNLPAVSAKIHVEARFLGRLSVITRRLTDLKEEHEREAGWLHGKPQANPQ